MSGHPRYRVERGEHVIDVRLTNLEQLFDNRDPAPFRERDLDPDLVEYLIAASEDLAPHGPFHVVFWFPGPRAEQIAEAFKAHFAYELERLERRRRRQRRIGQIALVIGVTLLIVLQALAQLTTHLANAGLRDVLHEGFAILSWVVMWRPVEALLYDWLPLRRESNLMQRLLAAPIEVRTGKGPTGERAVPA